MTIATLKSDFRKISTKRQGLAGELDQVRRDMAALRARLGAAMLSDNGAIDKLTGELAALQAKETGLLAAIEGGERAQAESQTKIDAAQREADLAEFAKIQDQLEKAATEIMAELAVMTQKLDQLFDLYLRETQLKRAHDADLPALTSPANCVMAAARNAIGPLTAALVRYYPDIARK